jgi:hypothetical protein
VLPSKGSCELIKFFFEILHVLPVVVREQGEQVADALRRRHGELEVMKDVQRCLEIVFVYCGHKLPEVGLGCERRILVGILLRGWLEWSLRSACGWCLGCVFESGLCGQELQSC